MAPVITTHYTQSLLASYSGSNCLTLQRAVQTHHIAPAMCNTGLTSLNCPMLLQYTAYRNGNDVFVILGSWTIHAMEKIPSIAKSKRRLWFRVGITVVALGDILYDWELFQLSIITGPLCTHLISCVVLVGVSFIHSVQGYLTWMGLRHSQNNYHEVCF